MLIINFYDIPLLALNYTFHLIPIERKFSKGPLARHHWVPIQPIIKGL
nr:MAG TPA: hypothetical protein [Caudoviricetes sp.]